MESDSGLAGRVRRAGALQLSITVRSTLMSEAELHILHARLEGGIRNKAARGEYRRALPVGLVWGERAGEIRFHPDEAVTAAIRTVFERFAELGSVRRVWLWFRAEQLRSTMKLRCLSTPHKVRGQYDDKSMADQVGVSKSEVSRETIEAGTRVLKELVERDLSELDVLVVYLDGIVFGDYHVLAAVGVDADGRKHVLGLCGGASENTEVTAGLLEDLVARGLRADRRRLFVIDGAKALRQAIGRVFGSSNLVQRCRNHKVRNVLGHLPKEQHEQARSTLRAAWKLDADEGIRKLEQYASWLEREWPSAAGSLREGLSELFTVNRLGLPKPLRRCLTTTNIIDSSHAGVRQHTNRVSRWQSEEMAVRWAAVTFRETEKHYRRITGYEHLWMLKAHLDEEDGVLAELQKAG